MARESQGVLIRRESSVAGTTAILASDAISFEGTSKEIRRQAGFADFVTGMRVHCDASLNDGVFTITGTAATALTVADVIADQASGVSINLVGHTMQNIGEVTNFNGPALTAAVIDVTTLQSTAKEKKISIYDAGQVGLSVLLDNEASNTHLHDALIRDMQARTKRQFDIIFTEPTTHKGACYFGGYVSGFNITGSVDNAIKADISLALASGVDFISPVAS